MKRFAVFVGLSLVTYAVLVVAFLLASGGAVSCQSDCAWIQRQDWSSPALTDT